MSLYFFTKYNCKIEWIEVRNFPTFTRLSFSIDFHFFKHHGFFIKTCNKHFGNEEESLETATKEFIDSKDKNFFEEGIYALKFRWEKCIEAMEPYNILQ